MTVSTILLEWAFSPNDFFEETFELFPKDYDMKIEGGRASATITEILFDTSPGIRECIQSHLESYFLGVQLFTRKLYELCGPSITRVHADGRREYSLVMSAVGHLHTASTLDVRLHDKDGNVIKDTRRDRVEKQKSFAGLVMKHRLNNPLLDSILRSNSMAMQDPNNELIHLYEIRDALSRHYQYRRSMLNISDNDWSDFGRLCNDEPLLQGRHRGKKYGALREATNAELSRARDLAIIMITAHLTFLESSSKTISK